MAKKQPKFDKKLGLYVLNGEKLIKMGDKFITLDLLEDIQDNLTIRDGEVHVGDSTNPKNIGKILDENIDSFNTLEEKHLGGRTINTKDKYFLLDFNDFKNDMINDKISPNQRIKKMVKYMVINPTMRPETNKRLAKKFHSKKVYNPLTDSLITIGSSTYNELLKVYDYDARRKKLVVKDTTFAYNYATDRLVDRTKDTYKKAEDKKAVIGNVILDTKLQEETRKFRLGGRVQEYVVDLGIPVSITEYDTDSLTNVIRYNLNIKKEPFRVMVILNIMGDDGTTFVYPRSLGIFTYNGSNLHDFLNQIRSAVNKYIEQYKGTDAKLRKVLSIKFQIFPSTMIIGNLDDLKEDPVVDDDDNDDDDKDKKERKKKVKPPKGGCNLHTWFPNLKWESNSFLKWSDDRYLLYVRSEDDNNCLFHLIYWTLRNAGDHKLMKPAEKIIMFNEYRQKIGLEVDSMIEATDLEKIGRYLKINIKYINPDGMIVDEYSYNDGHPNELKVTIMANHYFGVLEEGDMKYEVASRRYIDPDLSVLENIDDIEKKQVVRIPKNKVKKDPYDKYRMKYRNPERMMMGGEIDYDSVLHLRGIRDPKSPEKCLWYAGLMNSIYYKFKDWNELGQFCMDKKVVLINSFGGAGLEFFHLKSWIDDKENNDESIYDKKQICFFNGRLLHIGLYDTECTDMELFFRNQTFEDLSLQLLDIKLDMTNHSCIYNYLESLEKIFNQYNHLVFDRFGWNFCQFNTISGMSENIWVKTVSDKHKIYYPSLRQYRGIMEAKYGARTMPLIQQFVSESYLDIMDDEITDEKKRRFKESNDYLRLVDVNSCYAHTMRNRKFPVGRPTDVEKRFKMTEELSMGFYKISYSAPRNIRVPLLLKHDDGLRHDLEDGKGLWYMHEEINFAFHHGYAINVLEGFYWEETDYIFRDFVEMNYPDKVKAECAVTRQLVKDILNSCYGKLIQKIGNYGHQVCSETSELLRFANEYNIDSMKMISDGRIYVSGKMDANSVKHYQINKPYHLGVMILGYTRVSMLEMMKVVSPKFLKAPFYYHSTDSFVVSEDNYRKLEEAGYMGDKSRVNEMYDCILGKLFDEKDGSGGVVGYVVEAEFFGPNKYRIRYLDKNSMELKKKITYSGVPTKLVRYEDLDKGENEFEYNRIERKSGKGGKVFLKYVLRTQRNKNVFWDNMTFVDGQWYPKGYMGK